VIDPGSFRLEFTADIWYWRGPSPFHFVTVPDDGCAQLKALSSVVTYGWGMIPVWVRVGDTEFSTSLFPKEGRYVVPLRDVVRRTEGLEVGDVIEVELGIRT
jgi:hypothetical protein